MEIDRAMNGAEYHSESDTAPLEALGDIATSLLSHLERSGDIEEVLFQKLSRGVNNILEHGVTEVAGPILQQIGAQVRYIVDYEYSVQQLTPSFSISNAFLLTILTHFASAIQCKPSDSHPKPRHDRDLFSGRACTGSDKFQWQFRYTDRSSI